MWFRLEPVGLDYTRTSRARIVNERVIHASPDRVFDVIVDDDAFARWLEDFRGVTWTSDPPHGKGSTRDVALKVLSVREQFLAWDRGKRLTFFMTAVTLPIVDRLMEDIQLSPDGEGGTRVLWTVHFDAKLLVRPLQPVLKLVFGRLFRKSLESLARMAEDTSFVPKSAPRGDDVSAAA